MNERRFVYRIGPIEAEDGSVETLNVTPAEDDARVFPADTLEAARDALLARHPPETLCCEPELASLFSNAGVPTAPFAPLTALDLALAVFGLDPAEPMAEIDHVGLAYRVVEGCSRFAAAKPWARGVRRLRLAVEGEARYEAFAAVLGAGGAPGLVVFDAAAQREAAIDALGRGDLDRGLAADCHGVTLAPDPAFAADALRRGFGLAAYPSFFVIVDGRRGRHYDGDLADLAAALFAAGSLGETARESTGEVRIDRVHSLVNAYVE